MDEQDQQKQELPATELSGLRLEDVFDLAELQRIQDAFSLAVGVASIITDPKGGPITRPSHFTKFCRMIRGTSLGMKCCMESDARIALINPAGPFADLCGIGRLLEGGTGIVVGGRLVANWLIGQVRDETAEEPDLSVLACEFGLDESELLQALTEVPRMPRIRFEMICQSLHSIGTQLSALALRNVHRGQYKEALIRTQADLHESEERFRKLLQKSSEAVVLIDPNSRKVIESNQHFQQLLGYSKAELDWMTVYDFVIDSPISIDRYFNEVLPQKHELAVELRSFRHKSGRVVEVERTGAVVHLKGKMVYMVTARDVTEQKYLTAKINYVNHHDMLTGLYNRTFFEAEMTRIEKITDESIGLIVFDLDGLKLVNDTFGHEHGDRLLIQTAELIRESFFVKSDIVARIGGDEFAVLMKSTTMESMEKVIKKIYNNLADLQYNARRIPLSLSSGCAIRQDGKTTIRELFREADDKMYRAKLNQSQSARSAIVQTVMSLLEARDFITEGHADRLQDMLVGLARAAGLLENRMTDLRLLAQFHDIGKVGIPDRILLKPGSLEPDEVIEMRRHCEIGHRIAQSSPDLLPVADWVLKHQEWWDGKGYPLGLAGEQIPIECRILSIADAYDAMTNDRPYRNAMNNAAAIAELRRCSGTQFDPKLVELFIGSCKC